MSDDSDRSDGSDGSEVFEAQRRGAFALAYRMLGSAADAEDIVQDAWLRWQRSPTPIEHPRAWMTTTVTRLCLDQLGSARVRREEYVGPWLPEPIDTSNEAELGVIDAQSISIAFMLLLERLSPAERAVYLLRQVFELDYAEIAATLGKGEDAVRQLGSRARRHIDAGRPRFTADPEQHLRLLGGFMAAIQSGELASVEALLAEDVRAITDGGGRARAARRVVEGRDHVARFFLGLAKRGDNRLQPALRQINGSPAITVSDGGRLISALMIETDGARIVTVHVVVNPDKLGHLAASQAPS